MTGLEPFLKPVTLLVSHGTGPTSSNDEVVLDVRNLVDPASSHMLVSKIKPCMSQYKHFNGETAKGSLKQL